MNNDENRPQLDYINVAYGLVSIGVIATYSWPMLFILVPLYYGQKYLRSTPAVREWGERILTTTRDRLPALPAPKGNNPPAIKPLALSRGSTAISTSVRPPEVRTVDPYAHMSFWDRVAKPYDPSSVVNSNVIEMTRSGRIKSSVEDRQYSYLQQALKRLPPYIHYTQLPDTIPSRLSVPIGLDAQSSEVLWGDFDADSDKARILHAMIAGQTGSGKDALLRLWFTTLTLNNTPEQIQFVILDGKIDWMSDALAQSVYMAVPPAGGMEIVKRDGKRVDLAHDRMLESMDWVFDEIDRRSELLRRSGAVNLNDYNRKAARMGENQLPMLFLIASDVGKAFDGDLGMLVNQLIMKGRSYGIRLIISMQDPVGEDTGWRAQIGLVMSGYQQNPDHDRFIMGINKDRALVRPSQLPNPEEDDIARGLFVVRQGSKQYLVRTAHLPEEDWFAYIDSSRFFKKWYNKSEQDQFLNEMLFGEFPTPKATRRLEPIVPQPKKLVPKPTDVLTHEQIKHIAELAAGGLTKTLIMQTMGFMNSDIWANKVQAVEQVILATRGYIKPKNKNND